MLGGLVGVFSCASGAPPDPPSPALRPLLRVGTSGDYAPFSSGGPPGGEREGFDVAVARAFAADRGRRLAFIPFRWPELLRDLADDRFDLAMSGVTMRPERSAAGRFSLAVARTGAMALVRVERGFARIEELDRPGLRVAVNAGGHLEKVARRWLSKARVEALSPNRAVLEALLAGRADAAVTDSLEAPHWHASAGAAYQALGPFTRDRKAYLMRPERRDLAEELDAWLLAREDDGRLTALRARYLGVPAAGAGARTGAGAAAMAEAAPLPSLWAALDERLSLMPAVAEAKRRAGLAVEDRAVEARVLESALRGLRRAERERDSAEPGPDSGPDAGAGAGAGAAPLDAESVRAFYRELIEAAKEVQRHTLARPPSPATPALDLGRELRPALLRVGERIAWLLARLPFPLDPEALHRDAARELGAPGLGAPRIRAIAEALTELALAAAEQPDEQADRHWHRHAEAVTQQREAPAEDRHLPGDEAL